MDVNEQTASDHVRAAERLLRELLARQMERTHGSNWEAALSNQVREALISVRDNERASRPEAPDEAHILGYAGFDQIKAIVRLHWDCCVTNIKLWPSQDWAATELSRLHAIRNPAHHGRTLFPHEYIEAEGIARRLRFLTELNRRKEARLADQFWLYIEEAEDSLGNRSGNPTADTGVVVRNYPLDILMTGDLITVRVRAFDPWGRAVRYRLVEQGVAVIPWQDSPEFEWTATQVRREARVDIEVRAEGDPHPNPLQPYDAWASFIYEVRPPLLPTLS